MSTEPRPPQWMAAAPPPGPPGIDEAFSAFYREFVTRLVAFLECSLLLSATNVEAWEQRHEILRLLAGLPPRQRQVLAWTLDGYTPAEIAEVLAITPEAVRASLMKARRALAEYLGMTGEER